MKKTLGEVFTLERDINSGTAFYYGVAKIGHGIALINIGRHFNTATMPGAPMTESFTFQCIETGDSFVQMVLINASNIKEVIFEDVLPVKIVSENKLHSALGAYTPQHELSADDHKIFEEAIKGHLGVNYTPISVATQVVAGTNYRFICNAKTVTQSPIEYKAQIDVLHSLPCYGGKIELKSITKI